MAHIKITKGLDVPIKGNPSGEVEKLQVPKQIALSLHPFEMVKFKLLVKKGDVVKIGQPLAIDKMVPDRNFVSPAGGTVKEIRRGLKRRLLSIVIDVAEDEQVVEHKPLNLEGISKDDLIQFLMKTGMFAHIHMRPFNVLANPTHPPKAIFVKGIESAPFSPSAELQVEGHEGDFQKGIDALTKLTDGDVHLVHRVGSSSKAFTDAKGVKVHSAEGPHPIANQSVHIHNLSPLMTHEDCHWVVNVHDVIAIGKMIQSGKYYTERVISIAGTGVIAEKRGYFKVRSGVPIKDLIAGRNEKGLQRLISGDVLTGDQVEVDDFLHFNHFVFSVIPESVDREFLHFFRLGGNKYSIHKAYLSGHLAPGSKDFDFNTSLHGEHRGFIDAEAYDKVMPMCIPTLPLVKALMAEDYELAEELGLLEVDREDFALPTFVCPSKVEIDDIVGDALKKVAAEVLH